jgi:hypothetical protein
MAGTWWTSIKRLGRVGALCRGERLLLVGQTFGGSCKRCVAFSRPGPHGRICAGLRAGERISATAYPRVARLTAFQAEELQTLRSFSVGTI